jgi:hypothetical protein
MEPAMSSNDRSVDQGRRHWLVAVPLGLIGLGFAARGWLGSSGAAGPPAFTSLVPGQRLERWTVVRVHALHFGAVPVVLETESGKRYQVDVLARDPSGPEGVASTEAMSLYVVDMQADRQSDGSRPTDEEQGLGAMVLAQALRTEVPPSGLLTLAERQQQHPRGAFGVPLA